MHLIKNGLIHGRIMDGKRKNDEIKNLQLWKLLYEMNIKHSITWIKVKVIPIAV